MRVGFVVNPVAGMGGRVGLKGTDGKVQEAIDLGAETRAPARARRALAALVDAMPDCSVLSWGGSMGADAAADAGVDCDVLGDPAGEAAGPTGTTAADTRAAVESFCAAGVDVVLFVGGDGTAADVAAALDGDTPMLGVPAGVKVYSSVFAVSPEDAAAVLAGFDRVEDREVLDIDEDDFRAGEVNPELRAVVPVPVGDALQASKQTPSGRVDALARGVAGEVEPGVTYVFGPGSTVGAVERELGIDGSPLGVDVWRDGTVLVRDGRADEILAALDDRSVLIVSPIGGQGFVLGRGNQQLSPDIVRRCDLLVVASRAKLDGLPVLRVDTDDPDLDEELRGWHRVRVGRVETRMMRIE